MERILSNMIIKYDQTLNGWIFRWVLLGLIGCVTTVSNAIELEWEKAEWVQGGFAIGKTEPGATIEFLNHKVRVQADGYFVVGFGRDLSEKHSLTVRINDKASKTVSITIKPREWKIERVDGLPPSKVSPTKPAVLKRIRKEARLVKRARDHERESTDFYQQFLLPAEGRISGVYGSQRVLNGQPKRPHFGLDIANKVGTPIYAPASGVIRLAHPDMFYSGATVVLDHGAGLTSTFLHLDKIHVKDSQSVKQGELIGTIGSSGRATGPHLDWRINWKDQRLDPALFLD